MLNAHIKLSSNIIAVRSNKPNVFVNMRLDEGKDSTIAHDLALEERRIFSKRDPTHFRVVRLREQLAHAK